VFSSWDRAFYFEQIRTAWRRLERPYYESQIESEKPPRYALMTALLLPDLDRVETYLAYMRVRIELLLTAERLRAFKTAHGAYPAPENFETPIDPMTGERIEYERLGEGFVLRSGAKRGGDNEEPLTWKWKR